MDLMADLHRINQSPEAIRARRIRREARETMVYDRIAAAMGKPSAVRGMTRHAAVVDEAARFDQLSKEAAGQWNMWGEEPHEGALLGEQHPGAAALLIVREALGEYHLPTDVDLRYRGMKRLSGHGAYGMDDGFVFVQASFSSRSGPKHYVDIPVVVRAGRMLSPSIMIHQGVERVITQHTLDDIVGMGEFQQRVPDRLNMYAPPAPERQGAPSREVPIVRPKTMYSVLPRRTLTSRLEVQAALRGHRTAADPLREPPLPRASQLKMKIYQLQQQLAKASDLATRSRLSGEIKKLQYEMEHETGQYDLGDDPMQGYLDRIKALPGRQRMSEQDAEASVDGHACMAGRALQGRVVEGFYSPQVTGFVPNGEPGADVPGADGSDLDPAERPTDDHLWPSAAVRTTRAVHVYGREGSRFTIPKGEEGEVVRDVDGCNRAIYVRWYGLGYSATVARDALRLV